MLQYYVMYFTRINNKVIYLNHDSGNLKRYLFGRIETI